MQKKINQHNNNYYFSDKLRRQLDQISQHPLTIVEAPSGFGKTTAVREYLKEKLTDGACEYWYTCFGESASMAWMGICELFSNINARVAEDLKNLKMPTMDTLFYITSYLRDIQCQAETYFVVDNYQLVNCDIPRELIGVFSLHGNPKLHMIFITQQLEAKQQISIHNNNIHTIDASSFFFDREGTASLFRLEGIRLTEDELEKIFMSTEGWVSAIRLQMINFIETGSFDLAADIEQLVEKAIWNNLTEKEKDFFLTVSVLDSFTIRQTSIMLEQQVPPEEVVDLLKHNDFIRYLPDKGLYSMHSILQEYLRSRLYNQMPEAYQNQIFRKAGISCAAMSQYYPASEFFYKIKDFDAILSLPFSREYLDQQKEKYQWDFIVTIVNECPEEILCKYPFTMITFGYYTLMNGQTHTYRKICKLLSGAVQKYASLGQEELQRIKGEYTLLATLQDFNNIPKMIEGHEAALEILGKPSGIIKNDSPWLFGTTSVLNMFWREVGELENELQQIDIGAKLYYKLAEGHGIGYNIIMRAEAMLMRGEDDEAEILCHKALYEAHSYSQTGICICAELVLVRIAILRGDVEGYFTAVRNIQGYAKDNSNLYILHMVEFCMSVIGLTLDVKEYVAPWIYDLESMKKVLYAPVLPHAQPFYLKILLMEKRYNELYGISELILEASKNLDENVTYLMPQVYCNKYLAIAKYNNGEHLEAREYLKQALAIALPDKIYLPFAQGIGRLNPLLEALKNSVPDKEGINAMLKLGRRQEKGMKMIRKAIISDKSPLTPREREIAKLARERLSAKEIADKLYISEATVRTILRNVYSKLNIHSKTELGSKEF